MRELDRLTVQAEGISSLDLMERAARKVAASVAARCPQTERPVVVFAGPGNNGGDGLAVARLLSQRGYGDISAYLFDTHNSLSDDCAANARRLQTECPEVRFCEVRQQFQAPQLAAGTIVIDALFGTGLDRPLGGGFAALVKLINASPAEVVSIDMPSGLMSEDNSLNSPSAIVRASCTLTLGLPKLSLLLDDCLPYCGETLALDIGLSREKTEEAETDFFLSDFQQIRLLLKPRPAYGHKGTFGHVLHVTGQYGMAGAAVLAARAALRAGVGKVTVHTPKLNNDILQAAVPEAVLRHDRHEQIFTQTESTEGYGALAIGCGIGTDKQTALAFIEQVSRAKVPVVIDADGINILGGHKGWIAQVPENAVLTPHPREMQRLGICKDDSFHTLLEAVRMAKLHRFHIVLKAHRTAVCTPEGRVYFNPTGNSGMATAGSGDVLTGVISALLAQQYAPESACRLGVFLHGLAGDLAARKLGGHSVTASDIIGHLPQAFLQLEQGTQDCPSQEAAEAVRL